MLKTRLIPVLYLMNGYLVRSQAFTNHQILGNPLAQVDRFNQWNVDELIYLDITREGDHKYVRSDLGDIDSKALTIEHILRQVSKKSFMPLTFGGKIKTVAQAGRILELGADKVSINTEAARRPEIISDLSQEFGAQAVVVSVDVKKINDNYQVYIENGAIDAEKELCEWIKEIEDRGGGEILINSIDNDGNSKGYDRELLRVVVSNSKVPIVACGGVGDYKHFAEGIDDDVSAVAAGNIFHFRELAYPYAKKYLQRRGYNVR